MFLRLLALLAAGSVGSAPLAPRAAANSTSSDPCMALYNSTGARPSVVLQCLQTIPFDSTLRDNVMAMASSMYTLDIFQYNQLGDPSPLLNQGVNIAAEFSRIKNTTYASDYDFQTDLSNVMNSLNDGHHAWTSCYRSYFQTTQQFPITALDINNSGSVEIYLVPDLPVYAASLNLTELYAKYNLNTTYLAGAQVLAINDQNAWDYLDQVKSAEVGQYQDPAQRFNAILATYQAQVGVFQRNAGFFTSTNNLTQDNITMIVKTSQGQQGTIAVPWITTWSSPWNYTSGADFFQRACLASSSSSSSSAPSTTSQASTTVSATSTGSASQSTSSGSPTNSSTSSMDYVNNATEIYRQCPIDPQDYRFPFLQGFNPQASSAYLGGRDIQFYLLPNSTTGVMYVSTFELENYCSVRFFVDAVLGLRNLTKAGVKNLLIDTSNNGGGSVQLNQVLQRLLTGQQYIEESNFQSVLRTAPLAQALAQAHRQNPNVSTNENNYDATGYRNGTTMLPASEDLFQPGYTRQINGQTLYTSDYLEDPITEIQQLDSSNNVSTSPPFAPQNIVFTGNGLCGSACSSFTNFLIEWYNATAYIAAARPSQPIEFQAFAAGEAATADDIYSEAQEIGYQNTTLLPPRLVKGTFGFALRASISPNIAPGKFIQYRSYPAQGRFALTLQTYSSPLAQWEYVASQVFKL